MYQLPNNKEFDTEYSFDLMKDSRIFSSKKAQEIREALFYDNVLPDLTNYEWATLCISYCMALGIAKDNDELIAPPDRGKEIPSFTTCFQKQSHLWLALLSENLFYLNPHKKATKDDLYSYIETLWHTGAIKLDDLWGRCREFESGSNLRQRQLFLRELSKLAKHSSKHIVTPPLLSAQAGEQSDIDLEQVLGQLQGISVKSLNLVGSGIRFDIYEISLDHYADLQKQKRALCSALGKSTSDIVISQKQGLAHGYVIKMLRAKTTWQAPTFDDLNQAIADYKGDMTLPVCVGVDETGQAVFKDLYDAPHVLIAGATGSGKSVATFGVLHSLFKLNDKIEVAILDPKQVDYNDFAKKYRLHGDAPITDADKMYDFLVESVQEMEDRYALLNATETKNIREYHACANDMPYRIIMVDELADLLMVNKEIEGLLIRIAQKGRAAGVRLILSTQRPDAQTFSGLLRSNILSRIALKVQKSSESKIILDETGAEELIGMGDRLVKWGDDTQVQFLHGYYF